MQPMPSDPVVEVTQVTLDVPTGRILGPDGIPLRVNLGDAKVDRQVDRLLHAMRQQPHTSYLLRWGDGRVPRGAVVGKNVLTWTQHGIAYSDGEMIGTYDRLVDTRDKQVMLVHIFNEQ